MPMLENITTNGPSPDPESALIVPGSKPLFRHMPWTVWLVALLAALLHLAPHWRAQIQTPSGWTYTGNLNGSPDVMQYRVWMRQSQREGPIVKSNFTTEPNAPHIPVFLYYAIGQVSRYLCASPDYVFIYAGALLAFLATVVMFATVRLFLPSPYQTWWVFTVILIGGGLGAHLKLLASCEWANRIFFLKQTLLDGARSYPLFEDYRSHYIFSTLFDAHFLFILLLMLLVILSLYFTVASPAIWRVLLSAMSSAAITAIHGYDGALLIAITGAVWVVCWRKRLAARQAAFAMTITIIAISLAILWFTSVFRSSGLPHPSWRSDYILPATILVAYPIAWLLIAWGGVHYWHRATLKECFLMGWALGLTALTLSGPFFPYTDRATMTLQIPLYLIAGGIFFRHRRRVGALATITVILLLATTPAFVCRFFWRVSTFREDSAHRSLSPEQARISVCSFSSPDHDEILSYLDEHATGSDVLLVNKKEKDWETDDLWLAPDFRGLHYCGHWFLTVDYKKKQIEVIEFYASANEHAQIQFLRERGITLVYVAARDDPNHFDTVSGLTCVVETGLGSIYRFDQVVPTASTAPHAN